MKKLRIFISSPGDVQQERILAKKVITELNKTFAKHIVLEPLFWEDMPLLASSTFQEGIDQVINKYSIDIAIFILWSRLGSPLGKSYIKPDGSPYYSGTEYEFDMMMEAFHKNGHPRMMVYIKDTPIKDRLLYAKDTELEEVIKQHNALKVFIKEHFHDSDTGVSYAYTSFGENVSFESRLKTHLTSIILDSTGTHGNIIEWQGNPYVGLNSYELEQSPIFFGREKSVNDIMPNILETIGNGKMPSLILLGESGSGKSSFIKAGVFPMLDNLDGNLKFVLESTSPSLLGEKIYNNFVQLFLSYYPQLKENPVSDEIVSGIPENYNFSHLRYALKNVEIEKHPLLFIDQFEELFSDAKISEDNRLLFLRLLRGLIGTQRVFIIISMRNDFYSKFASYVDFGFIKQQATLTYDMPPMGTAELASIIREPARMAGLEWELDKHGNSLDSEIVNEASQLKNLPLIEFALSDLYHYKNEKGILTFDAYKNIGGLKGAFTNYANGIYNSFSTEEQKVFQELLGRVVTVSNTDEKTFVRKTAILSECSLSALHANVIRKAVDAHIFISGKNAQGDATLTIVHEMLIISWEVISNWIEQEKTFIADNDYYEKSAQHWVEADFPNSLLLKDEESLLKAEYFYYWWKNLSSANTIEFLKKSFKYRSLLGATRWGIYLLAFFAILYFTVSVDNYEEGFVTKKIVSILATSILAVPIFLNFVIHLRRKPYFTIASNVKNIWICFTFLWIILEIINIIINPLDYLNYVSYILDIVVFLLFISASIIAFTNYRIRKKWKIRIFKIPFATKYLNREKYRIISTIISALSVIVFIFALLLAMFALGENSKLDSATYQADLLNNFVEAANEEIGLNTELFSSLNEVRAAYLKDLFPDSVDLTSPPNDRKYELARTYYYRSMPDSVIEFLKGDKNPEHQTLLSYAYLQKGNYVDAAKCLPMDLDTLLSILPNYWMNEWTPIDIFVLAGDNNSAKKYCDIITHKFPAIKEHPFYDRVTAMLNISDNLDSLKSGYCSYMFYYYYSLANEEKPIGSPILFSPLIWTNQISYRDAQNVIDCWNNLFDDSKVRLTIIDSETLKWPNWLNGSWIGLQETDGKTKEWSFVFNEGSMRFEIDEIDEDGIKRVQDHRAWPCRYISSNGKGAIETLNLITGDHFVMDIKTSKNFKMAVDLILEDSIIPLHLTKQLSK